MAAGAVSSVRAMHRDIVSGVVITSHAPTAKEIQPLPALPDSVVVHIGDHPVPGPASFDAADALGDFIRQIDAGAVVLVLISGGTTALTAAPLPQFSQQCGDAGRAQAHVANLAQTLLESGLAIHEMNAIRRRILRWSAGRLAVALHARAVAHIAAFAVSDVIGDAPEVIGSGPCSPETLDTTSMFALFDAYELRPALERETAQFFGLSGDGAPPDVPPAHHPAFGITSYDYVARNRDALDAMKFAALAAGFWRVEVSDTPLEGEAAALGDHVARMAHQLANEIPRSERAIWIAGGEPVVHLRHTIARAISADDTDDQDDNINRVGDTAGNVLAPGRTMNRPRAYADEPMKGGRMQVLALSASMTLEELHRHRGDAAERITILAAGTDGRDGPTDAAGAIVDCATPYIAQRHGGRRPERDLETGRSWFSLDAASSLVRTGPTGTNVMDIVAVIVDAQ